MALPCDSVPQGRVQRVMPVAATTARAAAGRMVAGLRERTGAVGAVEQFHIRTAERYVELLGHGTVGFVNDDMRDLMVLSGYFSADSDLTADELFAWQSQFLFGLAATTPQPVTFTAESMAGVIRCAFDLRGAGWPVSRMSVPDDYVFAGRLQLAVCAVLVGLNATLPLRAIVNDFDGTVDPVTNLGKQHHAWVRERGLPLALEHHDHPEI